MKKTNRIRISTKIIAFSIIVIPMFAIAAWVPYCDPNPEQGGFYHTATGTGSTTVTYSGSSQLIYIETGSMQRPSGTVGRSTNFLTRAYYQSSHLWVETEKYWGSDYIRGEDSGYYGLATVESDIYP